MRGDVVLAASSSSSRLRSSRCARPGRRPCRSRRRPTGTGGGRPAGSGAGTAGRRGGRHAASRQSDRSRSRAPIGALGQPCAKCVAISGVVDQAAGVEVGEQVHIGSPCCQVGQACHITREIASRPWMAAESLSRTVDERRALRRFADRQESRRAPLYSVLARVVADDPALVGFARGSTRGATQPGPAVRSRSTICCCAASVPSSPRSIRTLRRQPKTGDVAPVFRSFVSNHADQIASSLPRARRRRTR